MSAPVSDRLRLAFDDVQRAMANVTAKHAITEAELNAVVDWLVRSAGVGELPLAALMLFGVPVMEVQGHEYAHPERDGASTWLVEGPAYVVGAPQLSNPGVLPMRPAEPGTPLVVSGVVRSTAGGPIAGATLDVWQTDASGHYSNLSREIAEMLPAIVDDGLPPYNLRGKVVTNADGRYEYRTIVPGLERLAASGSMIEQLLTALGRVNERPRHIHSIVTHPDFHLLTHQIHFSDDPRVNKVAEGAVPAASLFPTESHNDPADYSGQGLDQPYLTLTCDYRLRPRNEG